MEALKPHLDLQTEYTNLLTGGLGGEETDFGKTQGMEQGCYNCPCSRKIEFDWHMDNVLDLTPEFFLSVFKRACFVMTEFGGTIRDMHCGEPEPMKGYSILTVVKWLYDSNCPKDMDSIEAFAATKPAAAALLAALKK